MYNEPKEPLTRTSRLYKNLFSYLRILYPEISSDLIERLKTSSLLYFVHLLSLDAIIDRKQNKKFDSESLEMSELKTGIIALEKSIRHLSNIFNAESSFWLFFEETREIYFNNINIENKINIEKPTLNQKAFEAISVDKSVMCHLVIYALQEIAKNKLYESDLKNCFNHIHIALQYVDDVDDFKVDLRNKQWTFPQALLKSYFYKNKLNVIDIEEMHKYLYISNIAQKCIKLAIVHFKKAIVITNKLNLIDFENYINLEIHKCKNYLKEINWLINKHKSKATKANLKLESNNKKTAIEMGIHFLVENQNANGTWSDFMTSSGEGNIWITGFVGLQLFEIDKSLECIHLAKKNLLRQDPKHFSFNKNILQDGDSTTFVLGFLKQFNHNIHKIEKKWWSFQDSSGGWKTYLDEVTLKNKLFLEKEVSVSSWIEPKMCVTAAACYVLSKNFYNTKEFEITCTFLAKKFKNNHWDSFWWTSPIYATSFAIMGLSKNNKYAKICLDAVYWLMSIKEKNYWVNPFTEQPNPFYTALALKAIKSMNLIELETDIANIEKWLINEQMRDGSWKTDRILRIPATNVSNPESIVKWRNSSFGVNCVTDDYQRVFSTSFIINAIKY